MPEPMSSDDYDNISKTVKDVTNVVAEKSMADAAKEVKGENEVIKSVCGNQLRKLRKEKKLGVTKWLTNSKIDILQNYFGITLRQNIIWRI